MKILLTGASGFVGKQLTHALLKNGHTVVVCSHKNKVLVEIEEESKLQRCQIDFMQMHKPEDWILHLNGVDAVINSVGIIAETKEKTFKLLQSLAPISLFKACEQLGVKRVVQISALGTDETAVVPYHLSKKQADDALRKMDLDWFVLRPSLIIGEGGASSSFFKKLSNFPIIPLIGNGEQLIQPIKIEEVITSVLRCLDDDVAPKQTIDLVGKTAISYKDWMVSLRTSQSPARFLSVPISIMMSLSKFGKWINLPLLNPDSLTMLQQNNVADRRGLDVFLEKSLVSPKQGDGEE